MKNILKGSKDLEGKKNKKKNKWSREFFRQTFFFCVSVSDVFRTKNMIHVILRKHKEKYNLKWLRVSMSYHKFANMDEILHDFPIKTDIGSKDFEKLACNCYNSTKVSG